MKNSIFKNIELYFFLIFSIVSILPFFLVKYVPSLDGPQHLYSARLISELIRDNEFISQFFRFNTVLVGNLSGQFILACLLFLFPAWMAEKLFLSAYVIGLALAFRYFIKSMGNKDSLLYLLIFPFSFTSLFMLGYYNFSIAFIPFFLALGCIQQEPDIFSFRRMLILAILCFLIFISHAVVFVFFGVIILLQMIFDLNIQAFIHKYEPNKLVIILKRHLFILISSTPAIILWVIYYFHIKTLPGYSSEISFKPVSELLNDIYKMKILTGFHHEQESGPNMMMLWLLNALILIAIVLKFHVINRHFNLTKGKHHLWIKWASITVILFLSAVFLPDGLVTENMSSRIGILFFFSIITWISVQSYPKKLVWISLLIILCAFTWHRIIVFRFYKNLNYEIVDLEVTGKSIKPNSIIFPVNCSENWLQLHFHCYLGVDKPIVDVRNPQALASMPLEWNLETMPDIILGDMDQQQLGAHWIAGNKSIGKVPADYIFIWRSQRLESEEGAISMLTKIDPFYILAYQSDNKNALLLALKEEKE